MEKGLVHIYYGKGKGKTSLSLGIALRAWGWGKRIIVFQFLKPKDSPSGELKAMERWGRDFKIIRFEQKHPLFDKKIKKEKLKENMKRAFRRVKQVVKEGKYDLVILDEILNAIETGLISAKEVIDLIRKKPPSLELVLTGRPWIKELKEYADYISEIKEIKHPFQKGIKARKGIEF